MADLKMHQLITTAGWAGRPALAGTMGSILALSFLLSGPMSLHGGTSPAGEGVLESEGVRLMVVAAGPKSKCVRIEFGAHAYGQAEPAAVQVVGAQGPSLWNAAPYGSASKPSPQTLIATAMVRTPGGSAFSFEDTWRPMAGGRFAVSRKVTVEDVGAGDLGFSTRLALERDRDSSMADYDFFMPSIWYKDNRHVRSNALAGNMANDFYWYREDRMPLPLFMVRERSTGATFSVCHKDADGATFVGEDAPGRIIDGRMKVASLGMDQKNRPRVGILFPGSEGERNSPPWVDKGNRFIPRHHPVQKGFTQEYQVVLALSVEKDFPAALRKTWTRAFEMYHPPLYACDLNQVYNGQIGLLDRYWRETNGSAGFPFKIALSNGLAKDSDYNWNMGFVGMQLPNAATLLREGIRAGNPEMIRKAEAVVDFWADNSLLSNGCPRTWYDPGPRTWRGSYPTFVRVVGDGLTGMLWAWNFEKKRGVEKPKWLDTCRLVGDWLLTLQNPDGSFPRSYDFRSNTVRHEEKANTSHVIPFLVDLSKVTGNAAYREGARKAGDYIFTETHLGYDYVGGTPDNPNVPDKEAASMALRAFLALYDLDHQSKWLDAATQTAEFYETWVYAWNVPIPADDDGAIYPKGRSTTGVSIIATGHSGADTYAGIDAFNFYRLYLYRGDAHMLQVSKFLLRNTKQAINWDPENPLPGYAAQGLMMEAMGLTMRRGHGVKNYLPWQAYNCIEPLVLLWDTFGASTFDIDVIDRLADKKALHERYSRGRNYAGLGE